MIKKIILQNWKSFEYVEFETENLSVLIGNNASGKSNFLDALFFIGEIPLKLYVHEALHFIRGGIKGVFKNIKRPINICIELVDDDDDDVEYRYEIELNYDEELNIVYIFKEFLYRFAGASKRKSVIFEKNFTSKIAYVTIGDFYKEYNSKNTIKKLRKKDFDNDILLGSLLGINSMTLSRLSGVKLESYNKTKKILTNIKVYDPLPGLIRGSKPMNSSNLEKTVNYYLVIWLIVKNIVNQMN